MRRKLCELVAVAALAAAGCAEPSTGSGCQAAYDQHRENARANGYEPDERDNFIGRCEDGRRDLN
jgi:hypothetical protein